MTFFPRFLLIVLSLSLLVLPGAAAAAEATVHLKDGSQMKGEVVKQDKSVLTLQSSVGKLEIPVEKIERIDYGAAAAKPVPTPQCKMGSDGVNACGYHCQMGSDGKVACADTPDGKCAMGSDGRVTCTQLAGKSPSTASERKVWPAAERKMNSNGSWTEGYNCKFGSNGQWYCASRPDGHCKMNSNGTWSCP